jgi:tetratricopeptide (TPR) repeat protein
MDHPAIAKVFDAGTTPEGRPFFVMEYVPGESITSYCNRQRLPVRDRLDLFIHLCEGIQHAHQKGIIHRDLKPSNVLVAVQDDHPAPRIIDFGVAKAIVQPVTDNPLRTEMGTIVGTREYMSPEQAEVTPLDVDTRSDVYSLGVLLYELLIDQLPFDARALRQAGLDDIGRAIRDTDPLRPSARLMQAGVDADAVARHRRVDPKRLVSQLRGDLDWIALRALEKDRTLRYQTANALAADVRRHLKHEPITAGPPSGLYRAQKFIRRHRVGVSAAATLMLMLVAFSVVVAIQANGIARERDRANLEATAAKQVANFLVGLFNVSDPEKSRGRELTAREILEKGGRQIEEDLHDQPEVQARLQATIGTVYDSLGQYSEAGRLLERALQTQRRLVGPDNPETLTTTNQLANVYWHQRKLKEAEPLYLDVAERRRRLLGDEHVDTLKADFDLASLYALQKRFDDAERLTRSTLEKQRRVLGAEHPDTLSSMNNLGSVYFNQGRYKDAEPIAREVLEISRRRFQEGHPDILQNVHNLATLYDATGRYDAAELLYLEAIDGKLRVLGKSHPLTCRSLYRAAQMYMKQGRYGDAESKGLAAYNGYLTSMGADHEFTRETIELLARLYSEWGQPARAAEWRNKLPAIKLARARSLVAELDRTYVPAIEAAAGQSPEWYQPQS